MSIKLSKGPVPPARLPTLEEQARGPMQSDRVYRDKKGRLVLKPVERMVNLVGYFGFEEEEE